ncbi:hypothetical protein JTB14_013687 [Gonioctena quinquepunctata]|nr:hypothetical protein JTB14_013687 [Gonioctena quinquepunctata]
MKRNKKLDRIGKQELEKKLQIQSKIERKKKYKESVSLKETINNILQENSQVQLKTKRKKKLSLNNVSFSSDILGEAPEKKSSKKSSTNVSLEEIVNEMSNDNEEEFEENPQVELKNKRNRKLSFNDVSFSSDILGKAPEKKSSKKSSRNISLEEILDEISKEDNGGKSEAISLGERRNKNKANVPLDNISTSDILENDVGLKEQDVELKENSVVGLKTKKKPKAMHETNTGGGGIEMMVNDYQKNNQREIVKELSKDNKKKSEAYPLDGRRKKNKANIPLDNIITSDILENDVELREQDVELRELVVPQLEENSLVGLKTKKKPKAMHETSTGGIVNVGEQLPEEHSMVELKTKRKKKLLLNDVSFSSDILGETPEKKSSKKSSRNISSEEIVNKISRDIKRNLKQIH